MKVLIFGGAGFLGRSLTQELLSDEYQVYVVTRSMKAVADKFGNDVQVIEWDYNSPLSSIHDIQDIDAVINLAGESIANRRWTKSVKQEILDSRIRTTRAIVTAINEEAIQPRILLSASAVGYYGPRQNEMITEGEEAGQDFLADVCRSWEAEAYKATKDLTRVATIRIGVVLGSQGALPRMVLPFRFYAGGPLGSGNQWLSWIHIHDLIGMIKFILENEEVSGPVNGTAPNPVMMKEFSKVLGKVLNRPSWLPVPGIFLKIGLGQMAEMLLHGQRAVPEKMLHSGFVFKFPELKGALINILNK